MCLIRSVNPEVHCPKNYLNFHIKTEPVTAGADATINVRLSLTVILPRDQTQTVATAPTGTV